MMNTKNRSKISYRQLAILALIVGVMGILLQFLTDFELLSFMLTVAVLGSLLGGSSSFEEQYRQLLNLSYRKSLEWLLLVLLAAYAFIELSRWFVFTGAAVAFLNEHWPGLLLSVLCIIMGITGLQNPDAVR